MDRTVDTLTLDIALLRGISLFAKMTDAELTELAGFLKPCSYTANHTIFWIGDRGSDFCIIQSGLVDLYYLDENGKEQSLATLKPGQFFGELSLLDGGPRTATARATKETVLLCLGRADFEHYLLSHAAAAFHILVVLGQRQRDMLDKLKGFKNVNQVVDATESHWHRVSDTVARTVAQPYFLIAQVVILTIWIIINVIQGSRAFDIYPFCLLALVVSVEAFFLSAFILVSQGRQGERDRVRADLDYQVNLKAHLEVVQLHQKVDRLEGLLSKNLRTDEDLD